jgi:glycogen operon protein
MFQDNRGVSLYELLGTADISWHGVELGEPDWNDHSHSIALEVRGPSGTFFVILNAYKEPLDFEIPQGQAWRRLIDTSLPSPEDIQPFLEAERVDDHQYRVDDHSVAVLSAIINPVDSAT